MRGWTEKYGSGAPPVAAPADRPIVPPAALLDPKSHLTDPSLLAEWHRTLAKTIAVDFDGTLHPYTEGWTGSTPADEPPLPGAALALQDLTESGYQVVVYSVRADHPEGLRGILDWLALHDLRQYVEDVTHLKPAAAAYIDDRAVVYRGDWAECVEEARRLADGGHGAAPRVPECPLEGCGYRYPHYHRDTLDGPEIVRVHTTPEETSP